MPKEQIKATLEDLVKYQYFQLASEKVKTDPQAALAAVKKHYAGVDDYIINNELNKASFGVAHGMGLSSEGIVGAILNGSKNYNIIFSNLTVGEVIKSAGYDKVPKELYNYKDIKYADLIKKADAKDDGAIKASIAIKFLENYKMEKLYLGALKYMTDEQLKRLYSKEDKKDEE